MAQISQQKLIEMEAEMDRFEQEILSRPSAHDLPRVIIGSSTFTQVSAQLKMLRAESSLSEEERMKRSQDISAQLKILRASAEQISSRSMRMGHIEGDDDEEESEEEDEDADKSRMVKDGPVSEMPFLPPPPPPPPTLRPSGPTPSFVPPQLRNRPPPPPPSLGPPRMRPPPPRPPYGGPMGPGPMMGGPGPGPGPYPGGPRPGFGPMGPMGPMRPMGPGPMGMGPGPMGPGHMGPGPMGMPHRPGGPHEPSGGGMYGVSSGEAHATGPKKEPSPEPEADKNKVVYSSAPVITIQKKAVLKKKKKKKKKVEEPTKDNPQADTPLQTTDTITLPTPSGPSPAPGVTIPSAAMPGVSAPRATIEEDLSYMDMEIEPTLAHKKEKKEKKKKFIRSAAGQAWEDLTLAEWDQDDFRLFCGDLGNEVTDETLARAFVKYPTFVKAKVIRDKRSNKTKGYGFVSFRDPNDYVRAIREMNGKYVGNRPIKLRKSTWRDRNIDVVKRKEKDKKRLGLR